MRRHSRAGQCGFSLVELMVALVVGLLLISGVAILFANSSQSSTEFDKSVRQIENGRFAVDVLVEDISVAGYFGEAAASTYAAAGNPCADSTTVVANLDGLRASSPPALPLPIEGLTATQAAALPSACLPHYKAGTAALVVRRLDTTSVGTAAMTPNLLYMQASHNTSDLNATYLVSANPASLVLKAKNGATNSVRRYLTRIYYVASCNECGHDTVPTLKRAELRGSAFVVSPLAEGIEQVGFDYGFDTDNDGIPDQWRGLNAPGSDVATAGIGTLRWSNVVAVRVHAVSRTTEATSGFVDARTYSMGLDGTATFTVGPINDAFKRRAYTSTARLNSVAGNRERP